VNRILLETVIAFGVAILPLGVAVARPRAHFRECTIVKGRMDKCGRAVTGQVVSDLRSVARPEDPALLRRCQATGGLIGKCREPFDGTTVVFRRADDGYHECRVASGVVAECVPLPYTGQARVVCCDASSCDGPFSKG
jgi:hypothetical protein